MFEKCGLAGKTVSGFDFESMRPQFNSGLLPLLPIPVAMTVFSCHHPWHIKVLSLKLYTKMNSILKVSFGHGVLAEEQKVANTDIGTRVWALT